MKKYIALTIILICSFFLFGCSKKEETSDDLKIIKDRGYIIVGVKNDSPPFGFYNKKGHLVGLDIDIANEIAEHIFKEKSPANIKFVPVDAQNRIAKLNSGEVDVLVATMSVNEKRKLIMNFSMPYFVASQKIMIRKTSKIPHLRYFNKNGRLAIVLGTTGQKIARLISPNANLVGVKTYTEAYNLLINKQVDAILGDDCILAGFKDENLKILNKAYSREYYAVAIRKSEESKELLNKVNAAIIAVLDNKKINHITKKWILY
ncbi:MAG: transporter substrate-binding domain-containing protein [Candidatus Gastranaerophilales bacterium]|nr:transporter substrate-binding domain-containing protein [Candidatus Gastranaerophilales bacterium]